MTEHPDWSGPDALNIHPWLPVEPVRMGFGGVVYWRSRDHVNGRYRWEISPSAMSTDAAKDVQR